MERLNQQIYPFHCPPASRTRNLGLCRDLILLSERIRSGDVEALTQPRILYPLPEGHADLQVVCELGCSPFLGPRRMGVCRDVLYTNMLTYSGMAIDPPLITGPLNSSGVAYPNEL
jgi:hypothetical protein